MSSSACEQTTVPVLAGVYGVNDPSGFQAFYAAAWPRLVGQVYPLTGDLAAAEDAVQEAMVRAASHWADRP